MPCESRPSCLYIRLPEIVFDALPSSILETYLKSLLVSIPINLHQFPYELARRPSSHTHRDSCCAAESARVLPANRAGRHLEPPTNLNAPLEPVPRCEKGPFLAYTGTTSSDKRCHLPRPCTDFFGGSRFL